MRPPRFGLAFCAAGSAAAAPVGGLDGNGVPVILTGGFHVVPPFDRMSNVTLGRRK
jgi:hypothetical protein